jgi:hypothetical protein
VNAALLVLAVATAPGCTILAPTTTASTIFSHNVYTDSADRWSYSTPLLIATAVGLVFDLVVTRRVIAAATDGSAAVGDSFSGLTPR